MWLEARDARLLGSRCAIARAFVAKADYNMPTTEVLRDHLESNMRRLCGWEKKRDVPSSPTFSRASTAVVAREKPEKPVAKKAEPKKGEERIKPPTRLEKQSEGMSIADMKADLPTACKVGTKRNSKGYKTSWTGYKLHIDAGDGSVPISCLLTSASLHDSQVATPLAEITTQRAPMCLELFAFTGCAAP